MPRTSANLQPAMERNRELDMRIIAAIAVVTLIAAIALPTSAEMVEDCVQSADPDLRIGGCTAVIRSGMFADNPRPLANAYFYRGTAYGDLGESRREIQDYDQALRLDPGFAAAYHNRGIAYKKLGEYRRAIQDLDQALRLDPGDADAYYTRGFAYESLGDYERATSDWEQAFRIGGDSWAKFWQSYMKGRAHYSGAIDGVYGPATQRAFLACAADPAC